MNLLPPSIPRRSTVLLTATILLGCGGDGSGPVTASSMSAPAGTSLAGTVGQAILVEVVVTGSNGKAFAGGIVSFSVTSGGGSVSPNQANTDQTGKASATWTLGTTAGAQSLSASSGDAFIQFTATAQAGQPSSVESVTSFPGQFLPGEPLAQAATFVVRDQFNNAVSGVSVSFQASDGGSASPVQGTTASDGRVSTTWTLGPANGVQTLSATVSGISPATVTAEAFDPCLDVKSYAIGQTVNGTITSASCEIEFAGQVRFSDLLSFTLGTTGAYRFNIQSVFADPLFLLLAPGAIAGRVEEGNSLEVKALLDNGGSTRQYFTYIAGGPGGVGDYQFSSRSISPAMEGCETWVATRNIITTQQLTVSDCFWEGPYYADLVEVWLDDGETLDVEMTSPNWTSLDPYLELLVYNAASDLYTAIWSNDDVAGGDFDARIQYTVGEGDAGFYLVGPTSAYTGQTGTYTLTITSSGGSGSSPELGPFVRVPLHALPIPPRVPSGNRLSKSGARPNPVKR